ncbi:AI-2E family transporter [Alsobacter sp. SYSU M60028]|uniref:AI-2E family transporter n=2 Tax=Alsobacter ponti TaxID=2962936 RepID=A0ABT1LB73_9HYPH|nr:AI-2E family transporter [Alsobacter ponti]
MSAASAVFAPVAFALFGIALLWPVQERLQRVLPRALALVACVVLLAAIFVVFGSLIAWAFGRVGRWAMTETSRFQALYDGAVLWLEGHGVAVTGVWTEHFNARWVFTAVQTLASRANSTLTFWVVVFVYVILGLLEVDNFRRRAAALSNPALRHLLLGGTRETALKLRRYMVVRTQMSLLTGVLVGGLAWLVGLDLAVEWGVIAFTLNYVPFIGPLVTTVFPTALALVQFSSWQSAALLFVALNAIQSVVGTYIEPRVSGSALSISPPLVLFAVFFWAFLWGLLGAVIGVPIAIALVTFCSQHPTSRWLADLFSTSGRDV